MKTYDVCNDYSVELRETRTFYNALELIRYLKSKYGVRNMRRVPGANPNFIAWDCYDEYDDYFMQVFESRNAGFDT